MKTWLICAAAATVAAATPARSQSALDAQALKLYGGSYSSDCSNSAAPRLRVDADALMVEQGTKRMTGRNVQAAYSYFGQSPPPDYQVALLSEMSGGLSLMFIVYRDKSGPYITLDGHPKVSAALGKTLLERKYRRCGEAIKEAASAPPAATQSQPMVGPAGLLTDARFKSAYYTALAPESNRTGWPGWTARPRPPRGLRSAAPNTCLRAPARITTAATTTRSSSTRLRRVSSSEKLWSSADRS